MAVVTEQSFEDSFYSFGRKLADKRGEIVAITLTLFLVFATATKAFFPFASTEDIPYINSLSFDLSVKYGLSTCYILLYYILSSIDIYREAFHGLSKKRVDSIIALNDIYILFNLFLTVLSFLFFILFVMASQESHNGQTFLRLFLVLPINIVNQKDLFMSLFQGVLTFNETISEVFGFLFFIFVVQKFIIASMWVIFWTTAKIIIAFLWIICWIFKVLSWIRKNI